MNTIKRSHGKFLYKLARGLDLGLDFITQVLDKLLVLIKSIRQILISIFIGLIMLSTFFLAGGLVGILLLPILANLALIFLVAPFLLGVLNKGLKILRFVLTEYLYDKSAYILDGRARDFTSIFSYFQEYIRLEEERKYRQEQARRQAYEDQQKRAREQFEDFFRQSAGFGGGYGSFQGGYSQGGYNAFGGPSDLGFKEKYETSCDTLGVSYSASREEIRQAFRSKAKKYHPDLNKSDNATEMFQKVNDSNEFLTDDNIERYGRLN